MSILLVSVTFVKGQTISQKVRFARGQALNVRLEIKASVTQQAAGQAIDFTADANALHGYRVINQTKDNSTLHHETKKIAFNFEGMGQKRAFESDKKEDLEDPFNEPVKNMLNSAYDMTIDTNGMVVMVKAEKKEASLPDDRLAIIFKMLKDITDAVYPPKKGTASFFKIFPDKPITKGERWVESGQDETGKYSTEYTLSEVLDSTIVVDFKGTSTTTTKSTMMGREAITMLNSTSTGKIILDSVSWLIREKSITIESNGNTEVMGGTVPVTSKTTILIKVNPE